MKMFLLIAASTFSLNTVGGAPVNKLLKSYTYKVPSGTASAVVYNGKTYLISNYHVCRNFPSGSTYAKNEFYGESVKVKVLLNLPQYDLCVMSGTSHGGFKIGKPGKYGNAVYSAGYPQGATKLVLTSGHLEEVMEVELDYGLDHECPSPWIKRPNQKKQMGCMATFKLQDTTMPGRPGCSGSAMINSKGEYVGLINSTNSDTLSAIELKDVLEGLKLLEP